MELRLKVIRNRPNSNIKKGNLAKGGEVEFNPYHTEITLIGDITKVGRNDNNHLVIENKMVSRHHFEIIKQWLINRGWYIRDLGSSNGTFVKRENKEPYPIYKEKFLIKEGDKIFIDSEGIIAFEVL